MKKQIVYALLLISCTLTYASEVHYPWLNLWDRVVEEDIASHSKNLQKTLANTSQKVTALLLEQARARLPKGHVFNKKLKLILDAHATDHMLHAQRFEDEIRSEAQNAFDYKINMKINPHKTPQTPSFQATKNLRTNRRMFSNHHTRKK